MSRKCVTLPKINIRHGIICVTKNLMKNITKMYHSSENKHLLRNNVSWKMLRKCVTLGIIIKSNEGWLRLGVFELGWGGWWVEWEVPTRAYQILWYIFCYFRLCCGMISKIPQIKKKLSCAVATRLDIFYHVRMK